MNWNLHDVLDQVVDVIREYQYSSILIIGHSDARGNNIVNQLLSQQRAKAIYDYFIRSAIHADRLSYAGVGSNDLLIEDDVTNLDRALNRRLTLKITVLRDPGSANSGLVEIAPTPAKETNPINEMQEATDLSDVTTLDAAEDQMPNANIEEEMNSSDGFIDLK